jgi:hypothetical protein
MELYDGLTIAHICRGIKYFILGFLLYFPSEPIAGILDGTCETQAVLITKGYGVSLVI